MAGGLEVRHFGLDVTLDVTGGLEVTHFRLDVTKTSITSGFWPDVSLDVSLPRGNPSNNLVIHGNLRVQALMKHWMSPSPGSVDLQV